MRKTLLILAAVALAQSPVSAQNYRQLDHFQDVYVEGDASRQLKVGKGVRAKSEKSETVVTTKAPKATKAPYGTKGSKGSKKGAKSEAPSSSLAPSFGPSESPFPSTTLEPTASSAPTGQ